jgi:hypothetical protein
VQHFRERQAMRDDVVELDLALLEPSDQVVDGALRRALAILMPLSKIWPSGTLISSLPCLSLFRVMIRSLDECRQLSLVVA